MTPRDELQRQLKTTTQSATLARAAAHAAGAVTVVAIIERAQVILRAAESLAVEPNLIVTETAR
jgi:hypothetical protein